MATSKFGSEAEYREPPPPPPATHVLLYEFQGNMSSPTGRKMLVENTPDAIKEGGLEFLGTCQGPEPFDIQTTFYQSNGSAQQWLYVEYITRTRNSEGFFVRVTGYLRIKIVPTYLGKII